MSSRARALRRKPAPAFEPEAHRASLAPALRALDAALAANALDDRALRAILRAHPRDGRGFFSRSELIAGVRSLAAELSLQCAEARFVAALKLRPVRTQSGVTPITVLTKPFPCPGQCVFCPNDVRMPKSYLSDEPGCQRAEQNGFDPYLQTYQRLLALRSIGHATDKAELIVLGGTFSFYPEPYRVFFIKRCFDALNDFGAGRDDRARAGTQTFALDEQIPLLHGSALGAGYNRAVTKLLQRQHQDDALLRDFERASYEQLAEAQRENESAATRCVGLVLETRPDHVDEAEVLRLRRLGCTKVQIGYQSLSDEILAQNERGHDVAATRRAMRLLRHAGFKVLAHVMPNLLGATPESDRHDYSRVFEDRDFRPDELKVYPCSLIESAELMRFYEAGSYRPYTHDELLEVFCHVLTVTPRYARLARVIRDISSGDIVAGNRTSNFREVAERELAARGQRAHEIRAREIRDASFVGDQLELRVTAYESSIGEERFIEFVTADDRILGFCRLSLPSRASFVAELGASALLREVHVYGAALALGARDAALAQHRGLGRRLVAEASSLARAAGFASLAVISAVGTRGYYRKLGFRDGELYQHLGLQPLPLRPR